MRPAVWHPTLLALPCTARREAYGKPYTPRPRALDHRSKPLTRTVTPSVPTSSVTCAFEGPQGGIGEGHLLRLMADTPSGTTSKPVITNRAISGAVRLGDLTCEASALSRKVAGAFITC